ncbi:PfkB family carbohydrate kinase [Nocardia altamirensis]|uniref:PfkB family carbohydrate kinase n=1 Tax=Nocardia altamirensis TaxID=472158 RepID=UPI000A06D4D8|nr:PfkB family carbohydrate kinase [Nocardia altamirensis]
MVSGDRGVLTIMGDAVVDHIYRTDRLPAEGSTARGRFEEHFGGKGLNRAVAAARLGLRVQLISAVGGDVAGRRIIRYLGRQGVDTELVKVVSGESTPVVAVIIASSGATGIIGDSDAAVRLSRDDLRTPAARSALTTADAVLLTFEPPIAVVEQALAVIRPGRGRPRVLVQATPSTDAPQYISKYFGKIDYLIGTRRELGDLVAEPGRSGAAPIPDFGFEIAPQLLAQGVGSVCAVERFECSVRSTALNLDVPRSLAALLEDSPGSYAAFGAALAYRLVTNERPADRSDFEWATAAMAATQSFGDVSDAMPAVDEIDRIAGLPTLSDGRD